MGSAPIDALVIIYHGVRAHYDEARIKQVLHNLLRNATEAAGREGEVAGVSRPPVSRPEAPGARRARSRAPRRDRPDRRR